MNIQAFQSTLPREERQKTKVADCKTHYISIHAPTRGATEKYKSQQKQRKNFNPRSHERSDWCRGVRCAGQHISIHAPTRGATGWYLTSLLSVIFQSTLPREERRMLRLMCAVLLLKFQSTLPREERPLRASIDI